MKTLKIIERTFLRFATILATCFCTSECVAQSDIPGLIHWWKGDGNADDSIGGNNGTLVGDIAYTNGISGQGFLCDGGYVSVASDASLSFDPQSAVTLALWTYRTGGSGSIGHMFAKRIGCGFMDANYNLGGLQEGPTNTWSHFAMVSSNGITQFYANGVYAGSCDGCFLGPTNDAPLEIADSGTCNEPFYGIIDDFCIYNRALSADE